MAVNGRAYTRDICPHTGLRATSSYKKGCRCTVCVAVNRRNYRRWYAKNRATRHFGATPYREEPAMANDYIDHFTVLDQRLADYGNRIAAARSKADKVEQDLDASNGLKKRIADLQSALNRLEARVSKLESNPSREVPNSPRQGREVK